MQTTADFETLIARFSPPTNTPIVLGVSGGSDSLAMLLLVHDWALQSGRPLVVLTVDHRLRVEAADEANWVANLTNALGHEHKTLQWNDPRSSQAAARRARYELLSIAAKQYGACLILTGHTFDDVVETAIIRRRRGVRGSNIAGPSLVAPVPVWPEGRGLTLLRPLLRVRRASLRQFLSARDTAWIDDPSNEKRDFERVRTRQFLARHPNLQRTADQYVERAILQRHESQARLASELRKVRVHASGLIDTGSARISAALLTVLTRLASGSANDPRAKAIQNLMAELDRPGKRQTLGGAWFQQGPDSLLIGRDPAPLSTKDGSTLHDGRFERDPGATLPGRVEMPMIVRETAPPDPHWREVISERLAHLIACYEAPLLNPVSE